MKGRALMHRARGWSPSPAGAGPVLILFGLEAASLADSTAFGTLAPEIQATFGVSDSTFVLIVSLYVAISTMLTVPIGYLADRMNRVHMVRVAALMWAGAAILTGLAPALSVLILARFIGAIGRSVNDPTHPSLLADYYAPEELPRIFAVYGFAGILPLTVAPVAGAVASILGDWRPVMVVLAAPTVVVAVASLRLREPDRGGTLRQRPAIGGKLAFRDAYRRLRAIDSLRRIWLAAFLLGSAIIGLGTLQNLFFDRVYGVGSTGRGLITFLGGVGLSVGYLTGGALARREMTKGRPERMPVVIGLFLVGYGFAIALMAVLPWFAGSVAMATLAQVGAAAFIPPYLTFVALVTSPWLRAQAYAYSLLFFALGGLILARTAAAFGEDHGIRSGLVLLSAFVVGAGVVGTTVRSFARRDVEQVTKAVGAQAAGDGGVLLACRGLDVSYDRVAVLFAVDIDVRAGEIVALLGPNGAGKSTLLKAISGVVEPSGGSIFFDGKDIAHADPVDVSSLGVAYVPGRGVFPELSVGENLRAASWLTRVRRRDPKAGLDRVLELFPPLRTRWETRAGDLSGGEQRMLSLAMAFLTEPRLLLVDELSLGLAPGVVETLLAAIEGMNASGTTVVLVEQSVGAALRLAGRAVFLEKGEVRFEGATAELLERPDLIRAVFLPTEGAGGAKRRRRRPEAREEAIDAGATSVLATHELTKRYGGITAVDRVGFELAEGEILGIIGPNGAGKTTLFDLICGFVEPDGGSVVYQGADITSRAPYARFAAGLGRSFQDPNLWGSLTVRDAIAVACERHVARRSPISALFPSIVAASEAAIAERVEELIAFLELTAFRDKFVHELSTGSRRIVEIATLLAHSPSVLLLDEPSSGIAHKETEALGSLLLEIRERTDCSMIVIEHHLPLVSRIASRVLALDAGRIIAEGSPAAVLEDPNVLEAYLGGPVETVSSSGMPSRTRSPRAPRAQPKRRQ